METIRSISFDAGPGLTLKIADAAPSDRFILKDVDGLGAPDFDVAISKGFYQGRAPLDREIEVKVGLNPNYSIGERPADLRTSLYGMVTPYSDYDYVGVQLQGTTQTYRTKAWVKRMVPVPMAKDPEVMITLSCENPYFLGAETHLSPAQIAALGKASWTVTNTGSAKTGLLMVVRFLQNTSSFKMTNMWGDRSMEIPYSFLINDRLEIDTNEETRRIYHVRGATVTDVTGRLTPASDWFMLGYNTTGFVGVNTATWAHYDIGHRPLYWGI